MKYGGERKHATRDRMGGRAPCSTRWRWWWLVIPLGLAAGVPAFAQNGVSAPTQESPPKSVGGERADPAAPPDSSDAMLRAVDASYLTAAEKRDKRIFHGLWTPEDLDTPARLARAALIRGAIGDPSLADPSVPVEDRAEAAMLRGELEGALKLLPGADDPAASVRALRIRAEALELLGRYEEAAAATEPLTRRIAGLDDKDVPGIVECVRGLLVRSRVREPSQGGGDFHAMNTLLAHARDEVDRLYWPAFVAEAELLYAKDNSQGAMQACLQALELNPRCAAAWSLIGRLTVDGFQFKESEGVAARLDLLAQGSGTDDELREASRGQSVEGAMIIARARLRQNDPEGAREALAPVLAAYPRQRGALALSAAVTSQTYDFKEADAQLAALDAISPGTADGYFEVGRTLSEARQYAMSARYLGEAARRAPYRADPVIELGLMELQSGRDIAALDALETAAKLDPFNVRAANSLKMVRELVKWDQISGPHFSVRYRAGPDEVLAREMIPLLETMHDRVTGKDPGGIDYDVPGKTLIELMPDHQWFAVRIAGLPAIHTMAASTGPVIAMESPRVGAGHKVGAYDWLRVVRHEYTHTITLARTNNRIPHWFTEAAAVFLEDAPREYSTCQMLAEALRTGNLFDLQQINIAFVRPRPRSNDRALAYAQGHWMYQYMIEKWGKRAPLELMDLYAQGQRENSAFPSVLGVTTDKFLAMFKDWAREQVVAWGMEPREGRPTVGMILLEEAAAGDERHAEVAAQVRGLVEGVAWSTAEGGGAEPGWAPDIPEPDRAMADRWLQKYPDHPDVLELAVSLALKDTKDEATPEIVPLLEKYAEARPVDPLPHRLLAKYYLAAGGAGPEQAVPHLEFLDVREQHSASYAMELAQRYGAEGDWDLAAAKAERATIIAPYDPANRELAASVGIKRSDFETAERHIRALIALEPDREIHKKRLDALMKLRAKPNQ